MSGQALRKGLERQFDERAAAREFIQALLDMVPDGAAMLTGDWRGDPSKILGIKVRPFKFEEVKFGRNVYLTVSCFWPDENPENERWRRRLSKFAGGLCFMVDDIVVSEDDIEVDERGRRKGTHISNFDKLPLSALIQTGKTTHQGIYLLKEPVTDVEDFSSHIRELVDKTGGDPGAKDASRIFRPAVGINGKPKHAVDGLPFNVRMVQWNADRRYSLEEIRDAFDLKPQKLGPYISRRLAGEKGTRSAIWNAVMKVLSKKQMVKSREIVGGNTWYRIQCPFCDGGERSDGKKFLPHNDGSGTTISKPTEDNEWHGSFVCHHDEHSPDAGKHTSAGVDIENDVVIPRWADVIRWALPEMPADTRKAIKVRLLQYAQKSSNQDFIKQFDDLNALEAANKGGWEQYDG